QVAAARCLPAALAPLCTRRSLQCRAGASLAHAGTLETVAVLRSAQSAVCAGLARADRCSAAAVLAPLGRRSGTRRSLQRCAGAPLAHAGTLEIPAVLQLCWRRSGALAHADRCSAALAPLWHTQGRLRSLRCCAVLSQQLLWHA
ncbi:unnamed protein product, partial [Effrenium voratum]